MNGVSGPCGWCTEKKCISSEPHPLYPKRDCPHWILYNKKVK